MTFEEKLEEIIKEDAKKLIDRHHAYHNGLQLEYARKIERSTKVLKKNIQIPKYWAVDKKFNPFYVYKNRRQLAYTIAKKIANGTYTPAMPVKQEIPKASGGIREIEVYAIPDAAVSKLFFNQLLRKNKHRFSSFSYAYRNDRNVHFAIQDMSLEIGKSTRMFVAEFDFSKFFDSIGHEYLFKQFDENSFLISDGERKVIQQFLKFKNGVGIPQGTSISLFLANLVCWKLDREFERNSLQFARYADDSVIWSQDYNKINLAFSIISDFSKETGIKINHAKSEGISLLCSDSLPAEIFKRKENVEFLGYAVSVENVSIRHKSVNKIKRQISYILFKHLIQPLNTSSFLAKKLPSGGIDEALLSAISEIRRYLYGNLTDEKIAKYLNGSNNKIFFKGIMSFYPLVNNQEQLRSLDGWLVTAIHKAVGKRKKLLIKWGKPVSGFPFYISKSKMVSVYHSKKINGERLLRIPSFFNMYLALKKGLSDYGVEWVMNSTSDNYDY